MGYGVSHLRIKNGLDFIKKMNGLEAWKKLLNFVNWHSVGPTKIGHNFRFIFLNIPLFFWIEKWLWKYNFGTVWGPGVMSVQKEKAILFEAH